MARFPLVAGVISIREPPGLQPAPAPLSARGKLVPSDLFRFSLGTRARIEVMTLRLALVILFVAAILEAGGDALVRSGLHAHAFAARLFFFVLGGIVLFSYGYVVNTPPWDFGKLLGVYVVFFFVVSQAINWGVFHQRPSGAILLGGGFIVAGGAIISFASLR